MKRLLIILSLFVFTTDSFGTGIGANNTTAPCDNATLDKYTGTVNAEINWEPNTIQLGWYDGDTKLDVATVSQSCTYDGMITVPSQPTKPGYTFNGWKVIKVPDGYTELEYIQFCTTCQINTQKQISANFEIYATIMYFSTTRNYIILNSTSTNLEFKVAYYDNLLFYSYISDDAYAGGIETPGTDTKFTFGISPEWVQSYDGTKRELPRPYTGNANLVIGHQYQSMPMRVYNVKMYNDGNIDLDLVPARRNSDNVIGMFDTVSGTFFTNSGTDNFTAGPVATGN